MHPPPTGSSFVTLLPSAPEVLFFAAGPAFCDLICFQWLMSQHVATNDTNAYANLRDCPNCRRRRALFEVCRSLSTPLPGCTNGRERERVLFLGKSSIKSDERLLLDPFAFFRGINVYFLPETCLCRSKPRESNVAADLRRM